jgi:hypothetical protein
MSGEILGSVALAVLLALGPTACSSSESEPSVADASAETSTRDAAANCIPPGTPNDARGIGGYCETGEDCPSSFCSALFKAPDDAWFCTIPCKIDDDCGDDAACMSDARGIACVPLVCGGVRKTDAGADAGT